jgi:hypothetical protein
LAFHLWLPGSAGVAARLDLVEKKSFSSYSLLQVFQFQIFLNLIVETHRQSCEAQKQA